MTTNNSKVLQGNGESGVCLKKLKEWMREFFIMTGSQRELACGLDTYAMFKALATRGVYGEAAGFIYSGADSMLDTPYLPIKFTFAPGYNPSQCSLTGLSVSGDAVEFSAINLLMVIP